MTEPGATSTPGRGRLLIAFAVLPFLDAVIAFAVSPAHAAAGIALLTGVLSVLVIVCGAIPVVLWLLRRGPVSFRQILVAGLALGNAPFAVYALALIPFALIHLAMGTLSQHLLSPLQLLAGTSRAIALGSLMGMVSAAVFWFVGLRDSGIVGLRDTDRLE